MLVSQILKSKGTNEVLWVTPETTLREVARLLSDRRIGAVVVSRDGERPEGILSERDIVRELARSDAGCLEKTAGELMTREVVACSPADKADEVLARMTVGRFRHMPVVEGERMVGLISIGDVVKARLEELSMERDMLTSMIMGH